MLATLKRRGYRCALGSAYPFDPQIRWSWFSRRFILSTAQPGSVVILHDWGSKGRRTAKTLSKLLPSLRERGFRMVTLTELEALGMAPSPTLPRAQICARQGMLEAASGFEPESRG